MLLPAPPVLEFDQAGNLSVTGAVPAKATTGPTNHGITVDYKGNVWIGGNGRGTPAAAGAAQRRSTTT